MAPTSGNAAKFNREGINENAIVITGNTIVDALNWADLKNKSSGNSKFINLKNNKCKLILASSHRRESWGQLPEIANAIKKIAERRDVKIIIPMHKNPIVRNVFIRVLSNIDNIELIEPLNYLDFCQLMKMCDVILSDSSGAEEEGPTLGKPTLILRNITERQEAIVTGAAILVGTSCELILKNVNNILDNFDDHVGKQSCKNYYGDGHATERIIGSIADYFEVGDAVSPFYAHCIHNKEIGIIPLLNRD